MILPEDFETYTRAFLGNEAYEALVSGLSSSSPVSIRVNTAKWCGYPADSQNVPWAEDAYYLKNRPAFTFDPLFHAGCYYVQEASSMFLGEVMKLCASEPVAVLDLCAAPGGKSTLVRSLLPEGSLLVANEPLRQRSQVLAENLAKWGHSDVVVTNNFPVDFKSLSEVFDVVITDVPCSGEGMFRKDEQAIKEWSRDNVRLCVDRQRDILQTIWGSLKPGGFLVYSTCTFNLSEDEENIKWVMDELGAESVEVPTDDSWGITGNLLEGESFPVYRFFPGKTRGEGLFMALLRKAGERGELKKKKKKGRGEQGIAGIPKQCREWLKNADDFVSLVSGNRVSAVRKSLSDTVFGVCRALNVVSAGIPLAEEKGGKYVPLHHLAVSTELSAEAFPRVEVSRDAALCYLRGEAVGLPSCACRGFVVVTYRGIPLGLVKNVGNRANNMYPQEWRIRSGYTPENSVDVL